MLIKEEIKIGELFKRLNIDKQGTYKSPSSLKIRTTDGYKRVNGLLKTQLNPEWVIKTKTGREAIFTDKHKLEVRKSKSIDVNKYWKNVEELEIGEEVNTEDGFEEIIECYFNGKESHMYDMEVSEVKSFYANGFNSHNTALLGSFAINAFLEGKKVVVYTFETATRRLLMRYYSNIIAMKKKEIILDNDKTKKELENVLASTTGDIIFKSYTSNTTSNNDLRSHLNDLKMYKGWEPDIIIADYLLLQASNDKNLSSDNSYKYYKTVAEEFRNLCVDFNCPGLNAIQINRSGMDDRGGSKAITTSKDISESRGVLDTADFFATINQTAKDRTNNKLMVYIDKNRNGDKGQKINLNVDYEYMSFQEI